MYAGRALHQVPVFLFYSGLWGTGNKATVESQNLLNERMRRRKHIRLWSVVTSSGRNDNGERGTRRMVWQAIEGNCERDRKMRTVRNRGSAGAHACARAIFRAPFAPRCGRGSRARLRLLPPSDGFHVVVAFGARAACADRAMFRGSPLRPTKPRLPSSFVALSPDGRLQADGAAIVPVGIRRHFLLTRAGITVTPASSLGMRKQWHTR